MKAGTVVWLAIGLVGIATLVCGAPPASQSDIEHRLMGTWIGVSGHWGEENPPPESRSFTFTTNHQCEVTIGKKTFVGTYRIDVSKEPFQIDFTFDEVPGEQVTTLTIFDFPKEGVLRMAEWDPNWRRKDFAPGITFKKKESSNQASEPIGAAAPQVQR